MKKLIAAATLTLASLPAPSTADVFVDLMRIICVPELRYFEFEVRTYYLLAEPLFDGYGEPAPATLEERLKLLERHGLYSPRNLKYTCQLPETKYELTADQPPASARGMCGASPTASFSLRANGKDWFRGVLLNEGCFDRPSISSVRISDGKRGWSGWREMSVCARETSGAALECHSLRLPLSTAGTVLPDSASDHPAWRALLEKRLREMETIPGFPITQDDLMEQLRR